MKQKITLLVLAIGCVFGANSQQLVLSHGFNGPSTFTTNAWVKVNNSSPLGSTSWFQGNSSIFTAYTGADTAYIAANYNNTAGSGTISNWLISPTVTINDGGVLRFATRTNTALPQNIAPDRLEVYVSAGTGTDVGTTSISLGTFSTQILTINANLTTSGYPTVWTVYTTTLTGFTGTVTGRFGFRYFVTSGGPAGTNSSYIGIDDVEYTRPCPNPTLSVGASTTDICSGSIVTLTASGASTYTWSNGAATASVNVTPTASTVYTLNASSTPNCNSSETVAITVTVTPNLSVTDVTTCPGTAATLVANGASSYSWDTGATTSSIAVTPTANTTYYFVTGYNGTCQDMEMVSVALGASLSINATVSQSVACSGSTVTLTGSGASTYSWSPGTSLNSASVSVTVPTNSTTITYTLKGASGSCAGQQLVTITIKPTPTLSLVGFPALSSGSVNLCTNSAVSLTVSGASTYSWASSTNTAGIGTIIAPSVPTPTSLTTFSVIGTSTAGCSRTATIGVKANACIGIESISANGPEFSVFPNPFSGELKIAGMNGRVEVFNALGQLVLKQTVSEQENLHTENFAKGVYILKAYDTKDKLIGTQKVIRN